MPARANRAWTRAPNALRRLMSLAAAASAFVILGLALLPQTASAEATFELGLSGPGIFNPQCPPDDPHCPRIPFEWKGTVTLVTSSSADGTYTRDTFLFLDIDSNLLDATSNGLGFVGGQPNEDAPASVTLFDGRVTSFDFYYDAPFELALFGGLTASYVASGAPQGPDIQATAVLADIPEPETLSLMFAGLLLTSVVRRSRTRCDALGQPRRAGWVRTTVEVS